MRQHSFRPAGQHCRDQLTCSRRRNVADRVNALVETMEPPRHHPPVGSSSAHAESLQLPKRDQSVLTGSHSCDLSIPVHRGPMGRYVKVALTYRPIGPIGGMLEWSGGTHGESVAGAFIYVVRTSCQL